MHVLALHVGSSSLNEVLETWWDVEVHMLAFHINGICRNKVLEIRVSSMHMVIVLVHSSLLLRSKMSSTSIEILKEVLCSHIGTILDDSNCSSNSVFFNDMPVIIVCGVCFISCLGVNELVVNVVNVCIIDRVVCDCFRTTHLYL